MIVPDVIIAGAPKCGTTSLFNYLAAHPEICPSKVKETYYLMDAGYPLYDNRHSYYQQGLEGYAQYFNGVDDVACLRLEATPDYLYQRTPLEVLPQFEKIPSIFFILRKPSERAYSLYSFAKHSLAILDKNLSFSEYLDMVRTGDKRLEGRGILLGAIEHSKYSVHLSQWYEKLPPDNIHVFLFEDMVADPLRFIQNVASILGLDEEYYSNHCFDRSNVTAEVRSRWLHVAKMQISGYLPVGGVKTFAKGIYNRINYRQNRRPLTPEERYLLRELDALFEPYNRDLVDLTGLDLSSWQ